MKHSRTRRYKKSRTKRTIRRASQRRRRRRRSQRRWFAKGGRRRTSRKHRQRGGQDVDPKLDDFTGPRAGSFCRVKTTENPWEDDNYREDCSRLSSSESMCCSPNERTAGKCEWVEKGNPTPKQCGSGTEEPIQPAVVSTVPTGPLPDVPNALVNQPEHTDDLVPTAPPLPTNSVPPAPPLPPAHPFPDTQPLPVPGPDTSTILPSQLPKRDDIFCRAKDNKTEHNEECWGKHKQQECVNYVQNNEQVCEWVGKPLSQMEQDILKTKEKLISF